MSTTDTVGEQLHLFPCTLRHRLLMHRSIQSSVSERKTGGIRPGSKTADTEFRLYLRKPLRTFKPMETHMPGNVAQTHSGAVGDRFDIQSGDPEASANGEHERSIGCGCGILHAHTEAEAADCDIYATDENGGGIDFDSGSEHWSDIFHPAFRLRVESYS